MTRITKISVTNLFRNFNHDIPLRMDDRITIIHGPNGFGKTALLRMLNGVFNARYSVLRTTLFDEFRIDLDNGSTLSVNRFTNTKGRRKQNGNNNNLIFRLRNNKDVLEYSPFTSEQFEEVTAYARMIESYVPELTRIDASSWYYLPTNESLSIEDMVDRFSDYLPSRMARTNKEPEWLTDIRKSIDVRFIETQRLLRSSMTKRGRELDRQPSMIPAVSVYSDDLTSLIKSSLANYASLSQSLDRTFPARLVSDNLQSDLTTDELREKLALLEEKRTQLIAAGLLDKESGLDFQVPQRIEDSKRSVLSVYVADVAKKLGVFDDIAQKIDLLKQIVNERFQYKQMNISKDKGFNFVTLDNAPLSTTDLSSGEQHELVLLYGLLFNIKPNSLILIDEPELSLHVAWQMQFLRDLQEIVKLSRFDVLIATHSPQIIHDRWDLTSELEGPMR